MAGIENHMEKSRIIPIRIINILLKKQSLGFRVFLVCIMATIFRLLLDYLYRNYVTRYYAADFLLSNENVFRLLESYVFIIFFSLLVSYSLYRRWRPSGIVIVLTYIIVLLPLSSLYGLANVPSIFMYEVALCFSLLILITHIMPRVILPNLGKDFVYLGIFLIFCISVYVYGWLIITGGIERLNFDLLHVYAVRNEYIQTRGPFMGYFVPWQANIFNIFLICYALLKKNYKLLFFGACVQMVLFGMTGHKSFLLAPIFSAGIFFIWQRKNAMLYLIFGSFILLLSAYTYFIFSGNELISGIFIRRLFFVPASLHVIYYDFFSQPNHPLYMLSDSFLRQFIDNPYGLHMPELIAQTYWGKNFWPDVGFLGDAYGNFGFFGMLVFSIILGIVIRIIDGVSSFLPTYFVAAIIAMPAFALTESALFTTFLTHGLLIALLVLWIIRSKMG